MPRRTNTNRQGKRAQPYDSKKFNNRPSASKGVIKSQRGVRVGGPEKVVQGRTIRMGTDTPSARGTGRSMVTTSGPGKSLVTSGGRAMVKTGARVASKAIPGLAQGALAFEAGYLAGKAIGNVAGWNDPKTGTVRATGTGSEGKKSRPRRGPRKSRRSTDVVAPEARSRMNAAGGRAGMKETIAKDKKMKSQLAAGFMSSPVNLTPSSGQKPASVGPSMKEVQTPKSPRRETNKPVGKPAGDLSWNEMKVSDTRAPQRQTLWGRIKQGVKNNTSDFLSGTEYEDLRNKKK